MYSEFYRGKAAASMKAMEVPSIETGPLVFIYLSWYPAA